MNKTTLTVLATLIVLATAGAGRAQTAVGPATDGAPAAAPAPAASKLFFGFDAGVKGGVGGNYLSPPDNAPAYTAPYDDGAGGLGGGGGLYFEFRALWEHLGLEFDVIWEANKNWCNIEFNNVLKTDWIYRFNTVRLPLLLEGSVENDLMRGSIGIGPEFVVGTKTSGDVVVTEGSTPETEALAAAWKRGFKTRAQTDTFLCVALGTAFKVWKLAITLDIRYAYNPGQPKSFADRESVQYSEDVGYGGVTAIASSSMDLRILFGLAYTMKFGEI